MISDKVVIGKTHSGTGTWECFEAFLEIYTTSYKFLYILRCGHANLTPLTTGFQLLVGNLNTKLLLTCDHTLLPCISFSHSKKMPGRKSSYFPIDIQQAPVVQRLDNTIHRFNHYPTDSVVCFVNTYPVDSDLPGG